MVNTLYQGSFPSTAQNSRVLYVYYQAEMYQNYSNFDNLFNRPLKVSDYILRRKKHDHAIGHSYICHWRKLVAMPRLPRRISSRLEIEVPTSANPSFPSNPNASETHLPAGGGQIPTPAAGQSKQPRYRGFPGASLSILYVLRGDKSTRKSFADMCGGEGVRSAAAAKVAGHEEARGGGSQCKGRARKTGCYAAPPGSISRQQVHILCSRLYR